MPTRTPKRTAALAALLLGGLLPAWGWGTGAALPRSGGEEERVPILLVPGWSDDASSFDLMRERFYDAGWPADRVTALDFGNPVGSNQEHAEEVARAVERLRAATGAGRVDLVAHSMGGLSARHYLAFGGGGDKVRRTVFLGTPHRGTVAAILSWGDGGREMVPGSGFLVRLNEVGSIPSGIEALAVRTPVDLRVIPSSSAMLPGVPNVEICCPSHTGLLDDERVFIEILAFLEDGFVGNERPGHTIPLRTPPGLELLPAIRR